MIPRYIIAQKHKKRNPFVSELRFCLRKNSKKVRFLLCKGYQKDIFAFFASEIGAFTEKYGVLFL